MKNKAVEQSYRMQLRGITKSFSATHALRNVDFTLCPGEVHALVGENGAGKSTLMKIVSGVHQPDGGEMVLDGKPYLPKSPVTARHMGIGMIYQELSLIPHLTVEENIMLGVEPHRAGFINRREVRKRTVNVLKNFNHPEIKPDKLIKKLSLSARQLVEIARSLALGSTVLVFDEPTSSLNQQDVEHLFKLIKQLKNNNISVIYISHFLEEVFRIADRVTVLRDGAVSATRPIDKTDEDEIVRLMIGRNIEDIYQKSTGQNGPEILRADRLSGLKFPVKASLSLYKGEVLGIFGLVGSGRSEFIRAIFGLDPIISGTLKIGEFPGTASPRERWRQGVGFLSENRKDEGLAVKMSIADNITLAKLKDLGPWQFILPGRASRTAKAWIDELEIKCRNTQQAAQYLSGGNQQKISVARLLHNDVDILLLDEPTRGIDVAAKTKIYKIIYELTSVKKKSVILISSYIPELLGICDRIAVMNRGLLGEPLPVDRLNEHQLMLAATIQERNSGN